MALLRREMVRATDANNNRPIGFAILRPKELMDPDAAPVPEGAGSTISAKCWTTWA